MQEAVHKFPIPASGKVLAAIKTRARDLDLPLGRAAISLIEDAISQPVDAPAAETPALVNLEAVSTDDIIDELVGRLQQIGDIEAATARADAATARFEEAIARAEAAEAKLASVASALTGNG